MSVIAGTTIDPKALQPLPGDNNGRLFASSEWTQLIRSGRAFAVNQTGAAGVGNLSFVQLRNPTSSGFKFLLYDVVFYTLTAQDVVLKVQQTPLGSGGVGGFNLLLGSAGLAGIVAGGNSVGGNAGSEIRRWPSLAINTPTSVRGSIGGGDFLMELGDAAGQQAVGIEGATANAGVAATFYWAEVPKTGYF